MPDIAKKQLVVQEISERVQKAKSVVLVDARGLTVSEDTSLRKLLREAGVEYKVYKNTMVNLAIKDTSAADLAPFLHGPTAVAFSYEEATLAASIINKQLKTMPALEFKAGLIEGVVYDAKGMEVIAEIPSREVLLSRLLGSFKSPVASFARVVNAIAEQKAEGGTTPAPVEAAAEPAPVAEEAPAEAPAAEEAAPEAPAAEEAAE